MTLSTYYNYNRYPFQSPNNNNNNFEECINFHEESLHDELAPQNNYHDDFSSYLDESFFLPTSIPYFDTNYPEIHPINEIFPIDDNYDYNYLPCPKRQKCCFQEDEVLLHSSMFQEVMSLEEFVSNPNPSSFQVEPFCVGQEFNVTPPDKGIDAKCEKNLSDKTISTQSKAARERRRKIKEKTQELGKLVPGGPKMNTAEMLNAAAKYVKYLQAQVGMLQLMEETLVKEDKAALPTEDLHKLVVSPYVQEKLYSEERCFVPKEFVTTLTNDDDVRSKSTILKGLKQLIGTEIEKKPIKQE